MEEHKTPSYKWMYPVALLLTLVILGFGIFLMVAKGDRVVFAAGCVSLIAVTLAWAMTLTLNATRRQVAGSLETSLAGVRQMMDQLAAQLNKIGEQQLISERSKAIAFRSNELQALRGAIREDIARRDWEAALVMASEIETVFGYRQEAQTFRQEIDNNRQADIRCGVDEGMAVIDRYCRGEQWATAQREAAHVARLFPDDVQAQRLPQDVETRRLSQKKRLLDSWHEAVAKRDLDGSIEILKTLDGYLTPQEAQALQEPARQVFRDKLMQIGEQFATAIKEHRWSVAIHLGESIINEFPNSRMAQEVREKMDLMRQRAAEPQLAAP